jgi:hypothetical protein
MGTSLVYPVRLLRTRIVTMRPIYEDLFDVLAKPERIPNL